MKKFLLAAAAASALVAAPAMAADLAVKAPVYKAPPPVYIYSWTGCYVGGNFGGLWARKDWTNATPGSLTLGLPISSQDASSWLGGFQGGCNYQFAGGWVIGIQGDYDWTDAQGSAADQIAIGFTDQVRVRSLASVTGRVGYAWDRFLGYVKGGGAWERDDYSVFFPGGFLAATAAETRSGWTVGVGGEYAFLEWITGFVEYDYYDFGTRSNTFVTPAGVIFGVADIRERKSVVKAGLNFKFGGAPIVAKY
jgi:outer membrane immunogenic protein